MPTTIHLPDALLTQVDRQAKAQGVSRNRYIRIALERAVEDRLEWSPALLDMLAAAGEDESSHGLVDDLIETIREGRTGKPIHDLFENS